MSFRTGYLNTEKWVEKRGAADLLELTMLRQLCLTTRQLCSITMLDRAYRLSSSWSYFTEKCERLKSVFSKLKYPKHLVDSTVKTFLNSKVADQPSSPSRSTTENTTRVVIPSKDQESANIVKTQLKDLSVKLQTIV